MKVLLDSYNSVMQHEGGGVQMRIGKFLHYFSQRDDVEAKLFNKWTDKLRDYDVYHTFKAQIESHAVLTYARKEGLKTVLSSVIPQENERRIWLALKINGVIPFNNAYSIIREELNNVDAIIAQTKKEASFIAKWYKTSEEKIYVIPNGVNGSILSGYNPNDTKDIVLCVGRFDSNKNQLALIEAAKGLNYEVHFIGGAAIEEPLYFEECVKAAEGYNNIVFHGWLKNTSEEYLNLYKRARVVALVSHKEIFGNSLVEGAASGANLLATNVLPTEEWGFNEHCVKVDVSSPQSLCEGLKVALSLPLDSSLHEIAKRNFSWENIANRYVDLYNNLMN